MKLEDVTAEMLDATYKGAMVKELTPDLEREGTALLNAVDNSKMVQNCINRATLMATQGLMPFENLPETIIALGIRLGFLLAMNSKSVDELERMFNNTATSFSMTEQQVSEHLQQAYRPYDPESLLTQAESDAGMTYSNSYRKFSRASDWHAACEGRFTPEELVQRAPRVRFSSFTGELI